MKNYLNLAHRVKNHWWRYCLGMLLIATVWIYSGGLFALIVMKLASYTTISLAAEQYIGGKTQDIFSILAVFLALKWLHQRQLSTLISVEGKLSFKRLFTSTTVWLLLTGFIYLVIDRSISSDRNLVTIFELQRWFSWLPFIIVFTIIQSAGEELIFRGYILQALGRFEPQPLFAIHLSSLLFALGHFAPLSNFSLFVFYFIVGIFLAIVTLKDNRLELAIGIHAAINLFYLLIVQSADSPFKSAIWETQTVDGKTAFLDFAYVLSMMAIFYGIFFLVPQYSNISINNRNSSTRTNSK